MADRGKKRGKTKTQKFEYLEIKKSFLDEIKIIFEIICVKRKKKKRKIADTIFKGCTCYIFASLFYMFKKEHFSNMKALFVLEITRFFCSRDNQILTFQIFKCHDVIKCQIMKHEAHFIE